MVVGACAARRWASTSPVAGTGCSPSTGATSPRRGPNELRQAFERLGARRRPDRAYDSRSGEGYLRHLVVREGRRTGDLLAVLVTVPGDVPEPERLIDCLPDGVTGVLHAVNDGVAEITAGLETTVLHGRDGFRERILGLELELSAGAFMQTNTEMCDVLYGHALEYAELRSDDVAWDLYCGAGAIGLLAAPHVRSVVGIEIAEESVRSARANAARNGIANAEFIAGDVSRELKRLLELAERPTVAFVDPPRSGLTPKAVRRLIELAPQRIVYVSCNPTTLAPNGAPAGRCRLPAGARPPGGHVPAHPPHRVRGPLHARLTRVAGCRSPWNRAASWATPSASAATGRE